jgi:hypothetical protein
MLEFPCKHCGNVQFLHSDGYYDGGDYCDGIVPPDATVREERLLQEDVDSLRTQASRRRKRGYRHTLKNCPGFAYKPKDAGLRLIRRAYKVQVPAGKLPRAVTERAQRLFDQWDDAKAAKSFGHGLPSSVYIFYNPRTGRSVALQGD